MVTVAWNSVWFSYRMEDSEEKRGPPKRSMLSMVGDEYMDANVAANEREVNKCKST